VKRLGVVLSSLTLLAACGQTPGVVVDGPSPTSVPSLGLEPVQFNEADDACVDFYRSAAESREAEHRFIRRLADRVDSLGHNDAAVILDDLADQWDVGVWEGDQDEVWQSGLWAHAGRLLADGGAVRCADLAEWWGIDGYEGEPDPGEMLHRQARIWESGRPDEYYLLVAANRPSSLPTQVYARIVGDQVEELRLVESGSVAVDAMPLSVEEVYRRLLDAEHQVDRYDLVVSAPAVFELGGTRFVVVVDLDRFPTLIDTDATEDAGT
jgi:hypothetical protein